MSARPRLLLTGLLALLALSPIPAALARAEDPPPEDKSPAAPPMAPARRPGDRPAIRPYAEVITGQAKTTEGLFKVHRVEDRIYYEIPAAALGKELLWATTFARTQTGFGYGGTEVLDRVVRWVRRQNKVLLRGVDYQIRAEGEGAVRRSVEASSVEPILMAFDIRALGPEEAPVIDVTPLFTTDVPELSARRRLNAARLDAGRTFIDKVKSFPENIETEVLATYAGTAAPAVPTPGRPGGGARRDPGAETITVVLHHSMVALPAKPMMPRLADSRVGFFSGRHLDFSREDHRVVERRFVRRWRLDRKETTEALSEPVRPIVYYVGREVPEKWRPWIKKGIEAWQPAFEAAGFKNAIVAKDPPTESEDPDWDAEDVRYSVVRWLPATIENAYGPHIADPRTGEILDADVRLYHNMLKLVRDWYFIQASPSDPRAQRLPFPDELMGELVQYVTTHEVGHTLGLRHNMKASSSFTVEQLRDPEFTRKWGTEASIMDYARMNYVAQPGDGARLIPKLGPYDFFAIEWGYKPITGCATCDDEKEALDTIAARQVDDATLRFGDADAGEDPTRQTEDLGSDPVAATRLGLQNLNRVLNYLVSATCRPGEEYEELKSMYGELLAQRSRELMHVVAVVGGVVQTDYHYGRGEAVYSPVPAERQREAVRFLLGSCFGTPKELLRPEILDRIEAAGASDRILGSQTTVLNALLSENRIRRMMDQEALRPNAGYRASQLMDDVREGVWSELKAERVAIDGCRRGLQRAYVQLLVGKIGPDAPPSELRAMARGALVSLQAAIHAAQERAGDRATRLHLADCAAVIERGLTVK